MGLRNQAPQDTLIPFMAVMNTYDNRIISETSDPVVYRKLNDGHLICINAVVAGLEMVSSVVFTIVPPMLLKLGYSETQMSIIFGVGKVDRFCIIVVI